MSLWCLSLNPHLTTHQSNKCPIEKNNWISHAYLMYALCAFAHLISFTDDGHIYKWTHFINKVMCLIWILSFVHPLLVCIETCMQLVWDWYQNCNTSQILIIGGYFKVRESLYTWIISRVNNILNQIDTRQFHLCIKVLA